MRLARLACVVGPDHDKRADTGQGDGRAGIVGNEYGRLAVVLCSGFCSGFHRIFAPAYLI
jgi:hypothetical protein